MNEYERIKEHVMRFRHGDISYDELTDVVQPIIAELNAKNKAIAKKHGMKPKPVNLTSIMRNTY